MTTPLLHIYAQPDSHTEAWVVGDRAGLLALRAAIDEALADEEKSGATDVVYALDNEGFKVIVACTSPEDLERKDVVWPYTSHIHHQKVGRKHPMSVIGPSRYRELVLRESKP